MRVERRLVMKLYNSLTRKVEELKPLSPPIVKIYSCGPTVYDTPHVGNWSAYVYWDVLVRALTLDGYEPKRIINLTDVGHLVSDADEGEDKLQKTAKRDNKTAWTVAETYINEFMTGFIELNLIKPIDFPRATNYIKEQTDIIQKLKDLGLTYQIDDGIYLDTSKVKDYGQMARLDIEKLKAGARVDFNQQKRNVTDFALWKFSDTKRDMEWPTPAMIMDNPAGIPTMGFPGWHIECSAIICKELGEQIDLHTGGIDHIPVHHINEIAQMEPITHKPVSQFWVHNNHLKIDGGKISKSLGNGYTLNDLKDKGFTPMDFKLFVLQSHFQTEGNFSFENLVSAKNRLAKWKKIACLRHQIFDGIIEDKDKSMNFLAAKQHLLELANENLDTPKILASIDKAFDKIDSGKMSLTNLKKRSFDEFLQFIDSLLGLNLLASTPDISDELKQTIQKRRFARQTKDWAKSDKLRADLDKAGVLIDDRQDSSYWYYK